VGERHRKRRRRGGGGEPFGSQGIPSFVLEVVLGELQAAHALVCVSVCGEGRLPAAHLCARPPHIRCIVCGHVRQLPVIQPRAGVPVLASTCIHPTTAALIQPVAAVLRSLHV
jgi:hypothetical protein